MAVAVYENKIFAIGGTNGSYSRSKLVEQFDVDENKWMKIDSLRSAKYQCAAGVYNLSY